MGNLIHNSFQNTWFYQSISKFSDSIADNIECPSIFVRKKTFHVLTHEYLWLNLSNGTSQFKKQRATCVIQSAFLACIGESLAGESARKEVYLATKRSKIYLMDVALQHIPFRVITAECLASHCVHFIQQHMTETSQMHTKSQATGTGKKFNGGIVTKRCNMKFFIPIGVKHQSYRLHISQFLHIEAILALFVPMIRIYAALTPLLCSSK